MLIFHSLLFFFFLKTYIYLENNRFSIKNYRINILYPIINFQFENRKVRAGKKYYTFLIKNKFLVSREKCIELSLAITIKVRIGPAFRGDVEASANFEIGKLGKRAARLKMGAADERMFPISRWRHGSLS